MAVNSQHTLGTQRNHPLSRQWTSWQLLSAPKLNAHGIRASQAWRADYLVRDNEKVGAASDDVGDRLHLGLGEHLPRRVVRRVEDEKLRARSHLRSTSKHTGTVRLV
eukprot:2317521-Pleurochrysis_carterae.AAC.3